MPPDVMRDNSMFMGIPRFPQYLLHRYKRINRILNLKHFKKSRAVRFIPGLPGWKLTIFYAHEIERVNKRRKKNVRTNRRD